jgi:hypothetical protein
LRQRKTGIEAATKKNKYEPCFHESYSKLEIRLNNAALAVI